MNKFDLHMLDRARWLKSMRRMALVAVGMIAGGLQAESIRSYWWDRDPTHKIAALVGKSAGWESGEATRKVAWMLDNGVYWKNENPTERVAISLNDAAFWRDGNPTDKVVVMTEEVDVNQIIVQVVDAILRNR